MPSDVQVEASNWWTTSVLRLTLWMLVGVTNFLLLWEQNCKLPWLKSWIRDRQPWYWRSENHMSTQNIRHGSKPGDIRTAAHVYNFDYDKFYLFSIPGIPIMQRTDHTIRKEQEFTCNFSVKFICKLYFTESWKYATLITKISPSKNKNGRFREIWKNVPHGRKDSRIHSK